MLTGGGSGGLSSMAGQSLRAYADAPVAESPRSTAMADLVARAERLQGIAAELSGKLESIGERVLGAEPQGSANGKERGIPAGMLGQVFVRLDEVEQTLNSCHHKANRLLQL